MKVNLRDDLLPALITAILLGTYSYLIVTGHPEIPEGLEAMVFGVVGFYFGGKVSAIATRNGTDAAEVTAARTAAAVAEEHAAHEHADPTPPTGPAGPTP